MHWDRLSFFNNRNWCKHYDVVTTGQPPSWQWGWFVSSSFSGENAVMPSERDGEWQQHAICLWWWMPLTGRAYLLCSSYLQVWLQLTALTADKSGNIKENRRAAELRHRDLFSSSPHPGTTLPKQQLLLLFISPVPDTTMSELSEWGSDIRRIHQKSAAHHVNGSLCCVRLPPRQAVIQPLSLHIKIACQEGEEKKI